MFLLGLRGEQHIPMRKTEAVFEADITILT